MGGEAAGGWDGGESSAGEGGLTERLIVFISCFRVVASIHPKVVIVHDEAPP